MADVEEYFPRGGKKPTTTHFKQNANFLGAPEKGEKKKKRPKKKTEGDDGYLSDDDTKEIDQSFKNCAYGLSYKTIKEGVLILGRVKSVLETKVTISLPCRMIGSVMACHVSEPYNKILEDYVNDKVDKVTELEQMFQPGQYISVKVLEVKEIQLMLSVMPQHINSQKTAADLHKGTLIQAAVSSVEDHGYVMDIGIPGTRSFLPKNSTNPEISLDVGMVTWCAVKSAPTDGVVTLSNQLEALQNTYLRKKPSNPSTLLPATTLDFVVDTPLDNGIEGHVFGDLTSYIQRQHADTVKGKKPALGQKIKAQLLYVMPTRNTPFLTMKSIFNTTYPDLAAEQLLKDGAIIDEAQVLKITGRSIHFKLTGGCYGTMSLKRIQVDEELTDEQVVAKSYPIGSTHKVRVICYNLSDYVYSVTDQPDVVGLKYFSLDQLKVGELVDGTVRSVTDNHVVLSVGRLSGYVSQAHLSDSGIFIDPKKSSTSKLPKKKYKVGQSVKARVLAVDPAKQTLFLTLKPSLLADIEVLQSYDMAEVGKAYTGVLKIVRDFVVVSFFNNVTAFVHKQYVTKEPLEHLYDAFHIGQIVNCTILKVDREAKKMSGSLTTSPFWPAKKLEPGDKRKQKENNNVQNKKPKTDEEIDVTNKPKKQKKSEEKITKEDTNTKKDKKKRKSSESENNGKETEIKQEPETKNDKKKKIKLEKQPTTDDSNTEPENESSPKKNKKKNKKTKKSEQIADIEEKPTKKIKAEIISEESDAIETDIQEDTENILTPKELQLIDITDCTTEQELKKRAATLRKAVETQQRRIAKTIKKIDKLEKSGLTAQNKKTHTLMHNDNMVAIERLKKFEDAFQDVVLKLKDIGCEKQTQERRKKKDRVKDEVVKKEGSVKMEKVDIKVVDSLEPALAAPSVKDFWSANVQELSKTQQEEESSSSEDEEQDQPKKKRKKLSVADKLAKARDEEERVREMERRAIESETQPRSSEQFERALLAHPNSSQLWIAYMAFYLQAAEVDKARSVARKALNSVSFREEDEKLNIWYAIINLENRFGTKESQQKILEEALQMNEPFKIHSKLLDIYVETSKHQELSGLVDLMMRKYKRDPNCYIMCGAACFKLGLVDKSRQVMQKAISVLEKKEHVAVLVQFALLERNHGARERAEALFEQVLAVYPQRVDVCSAYVDMLLKSGDNDAIRQVMERMTSQKMPARKMKILYKKWIEVEEKIGDHDQVEKIKQRAMAYIEKAKF